jgi:hypothetical protein
MKQPQLSTYRAYVPEHVRIHLPMSLGELLEALKMPDRVQAECVVFQRGAFLYAVREEDIDALLDWLHEEDDRTNTVPPKAQLTWEDLP